MRWRPFLNLDNESGYGVYEIVVSRLLGCRSQKQDLQTVHTPLVILEQGLNQIK